MVRLGLVYEIYANKAVVLTPDSEFLVIKRAKGMYVGQQVKFNIRDVKKSIKPIYKYTSIASSIAAVFVFAFIFFRISVFSNVYGFVNVDINPSIEFSIDKDFEVLGTKALNDDAKAIVKDLDTKGKDVYSAIKMVLQKSEDFGYIKLKDKNVILVAASLNDKSMKYSKDELNKENGIEEFLHNVNKKINGEGAEYIACKLINVTPEERKEAEKNDISMGKYYLMEKAKEIGMDVSIDEIKSEKISDLLAAIDAKTSANAKLEAAQNTKQEANANSTDVKSTPTKNDSSITATTTKPVGKTTAKPKTEQTSKPIVVTTAKPQSIPTAEPKAEPTKNPTVVITEPVAPTEKVVTSSSPQKNRDDEIKNKDLKVRLISLERGPTSQFVNSRIQIINTGEADINLSDVKARYYFNKDSNADLKAAVYTYSKGSVKDKNYFVQESTTEVKVRFEKISGFEMYMEIGFSSGVLKKGQYAYVNIAFNKTDWSAFDQSNDYSYMSRGDNFQDCERMTAYISDTLVWGIEP
jgi:hypothetical protein